MFVSWERLYIISILTLPGMIRDLDANAGFIDACGKADNSKGQIQSHRTGNILDDQAWMSKAIFDKLKNSL